MNRRHFLQNSALGLLTSCTSLPTAARAFGESTFTEKEADNAVDKRLNESKIDYAAYVRIVGHADKEADLQKKIRSLANLAETMEPYRLRGLLRLREASLPPAVKMQLLSLNLEKVMHEVATCLDHFLGVYEILKQWGQKDEVAFVGLFHAVYGTQFNPITVLDPQSQSERRSLAKAIGSRSERWTLAYGLLPVERFLEVATHRNAPPSLTLTLDERLEERDYGVMAEVLLANSYEPLLATGQKALATRLTQFETLRPILSPGARRMLDARKIIVGS